jgi:hypothetical protein
MAGMKRHRAVNTENLTVNLTVVDVKDASEAERQNMVTDENLIGFFIAQIQSQYYGIKY